MDLKPVLFSIFEEKNLETIPYVQRNSNSFESVIFLKSPTRKRDSTYAESITFLLSGLCDKNVFFTNNFDRVPLGLRGLKISKKYKFWPRTIETWRIPLCMTAESVMGEYSPYRTMPLNFWRMMWRWFIKKWNYKDQILLPI